MKILLVYPPYHGIKGSAPPLGLAYIGAILKKEGYEVEIKDFNVSSEAENLKDALSGCDIIGISFLTSMLNDAMEVAKIGSKSGSTVVLGGTHVTALPHDILKNEFVDIVVRKEGELTTLELIHALEKNIELNDVLGISFKSNGEIIHNPDRDYIHNLDTIPFPARELLKNDDYRIGDLGFNPKKSFTAMMTSRGCPSKCIFCSSNIVFGRKPRFRSAKNIVDEMDQIVNKFGINQIKLYDDTFTLRPKLVIETCNEILDRGLNINWACSTRVSNVSNELLSKMKEAGCSQVGFGIESGSPKILKNIKKGIKVEQTEKALKTTKDVGIEIFPYLMIGNPGEDYTTVWETVEFLYRNRQYIPKTGLGKFVTPYPGTELLEIVKEKNQLLTENWDVYFHSKEPLIRTDALDYQELSDVFLLANAHIGFKTSRSFSDILDTLGIFIYNLDLRKKKIRDLFQLRSLFKTFIKYYGGYKQWSALRKIKSSSK
jgi:radical SAM superfamily enzyme YgiQ (UPF0313 family)